MTRSLPVVLDCDAGRRMGCATFCCHLVVRLEPGERAPADGRHVTDGTIDKAPDDGLCVHVDRETGKCGVWEQRPRACRAYDCNRDPLLQVVLDRGYSSLLQLLRDYRETTPAPQPTVPTIPLDAEDV